MSILDYVRYFYLLMYMNVCMKRSEFDFSHSGLRLREDIEEHFNFLSAKLARVLYDYIIFACGREIRHAFDECSITPREIFEEKTHKTTPGIVESFIDKVDPVAFLRMCHHVFKDGHWTGSFGGDSWAKAAQFGLLYKKISDVLFIDKIIDLQHNTGSLFSKSNPYFFGRDEDLIAYLNWKTEIVDEFELISFLISEASNKWTRGLKNISYRFLTLYGARHFDDPELLGWGWEDYPQLMNKVFFWPVLPENENAYARFLACEPVKYTGVYYKWKIMSSDEYVRRYCIS